MLILNEAIVDTIPEGFGKKGSVGYIPIKVKDGPAEVVISGYDTEKKLVLCRYVFPNPFIAVPLRKVPFSFWKDNWIEKGDPRLRKIFADYQKTGIWKVR